MHGHVLFLVYAKKMLGKGVSLTLNPYYYRVQYYHAHLEIEVCIAVMQQVV